MYSKFIGIGILAGLLSAPVFSQHEHKPDPAKAKDPHAGHQMPAQDHAGMNHGNMNDAGAFLMRQATGTAFNPAAWPMPMIMSSAGDWNLMWMGQAFLTATQQSGPRGHDKVYSANWFMLGAQHNVGKGSILLRTMLSADPATVTKRRYPLLFQTGETAFGTAIVDGQHPHELVMELGVQYARPFAENGMFNIYFAPVGDPALGPVAFPHRASAMELPQAALGHHWQDSTHIANEVITAGVTYGKLRLEASGFHGAEPDEGRWDIDYGPIDSWSSRLSVFPSRNWLAQVSVGRLNEPEALHRDDVVRSTASVHHTIPMPGGSWSSSFIWARNYKTIEKHATHAVLAETVVPFRRKNFFTGRWEWSQRDELFEDDHDLQHELEEQTGKHAFAIGAYTFGYTRDVDLFDYVQTGIGANFTAYTLPSALKPYYGNRPLGVNFFLRVRLRSPG